MARVEDVYCWADDVMDVTAKFHRVDPENADLTSCGVSTHGYNKKGSLAEAKSKRRFEESYLCADCEKIIETE